MLPSRVVIVGERPGVGTGDRIIRYSDGYVEYVRCGQHPSFVFRPAWSTIPSVGVARPLELDPLLPTNRAMKRAAKFGKKPRRRRF